MALIHEKLYQSRDFTEVNLFEYVESLLVQSEQSFRNFELHIKTYVDVDKKIKLDLDSAISCGLIINELLTNAYKYAFPPEWANQKPKDFEFTITVQVINIIGKKYEMIVRDNGIGIDDNVDIENSTSLGLKIVSSMVKQLDGTVEISGKEGTEFKIIFERREKTNTSKNFSQL